MGTLSGHGWGQQRSSASNRIETCRGQRRRFAAVSVFDLASRGLDISKAPEKNPASFVTISAFGDV